MKKIIFVITTIFTLILPFIALTIALLVFHKNIFDNAEFWYGYMAYFGTVFLAFVALWQNNSIAKNSERFMQQQLRQKIGYLELKKESDANPLTSNSYQKLQVGGFLTPLGIDDKTKNNTLGICLGNVGEDIILNMNIEFCVVNGNHLTPPCSNKVLYKNEFICFEIEIPDFSPVPQLNIKLNLHMENSAGVSYTQLVHIRAQNFSTPNKLTQHTESYDISSCTYFITYFNSSIMFK